MTMKQMQTSSGRMCGGAEINVGGRIAKKGGNVSLYAHTCPIEPTFPCIGGILTDLPCRTGFLKGGRRQGCGCVGSQIREINDWHNTKSANGSLYYSGFVYDLLSGFMLDVVLLVVGKS